MKSNSSMATPQSGYPQPAPLQHVAISHAPDASRSLIEANNDISAIETWLRTTARSENTLNSYAKEAYRFLRFISLRNKTIPDVLIDDLHAYRRLLVNPTPVEFWVADANYPRDDPRWRPFVAKRGKRVGLSQASIRQSMSILSAMFRWLFDAGYIRRNPMMLLPRERVRDDTTITRYLPPKLQEALLAYVERMPKENARDAAHYHRVRWIFYLLLYSGLRASEVASTKMGNFIHDLRIQDGGWWLTVVGKRNKQRMIPVPDRLLEALQVYRTHLGLPPLPSPGESTPLVGSVFKVQRDHDHAIGRFAVFRIIKEVVRMAAAEFEAVMGQAHANHLRAVSTHWLRHSYGSALADHGADIRVIQDNMGHESFETSRQYLHIDAARRYHATKNL